jgi:hypothetical protein
MGKSSRRFSRRTLYSIIFLIVIIVLFALSKRHQIIDKVAREVSKLPEVWESTQRLAKFGLSSSQVVENDLSVPIVLPKIRPTLTTKPLHLNPANPRYFIDNSGKAVYLTGSHTWSNFQDSYITDLSSDFDYNAYLNYLEKNNHNFIRLWVWEVAGSGVKTTRQQRFEPMPYQRTGPGKAIDGRLKFDLTRFNQAYFDRLRQRIQDAGNRNIYVSVMLFNGWNISNHWGINSQRDQYYHPWETHPFDKFNNVNNIDGDLNFNHSGEEVHALASTRITAIQEAYIRKVIDTVNDLDNVLYEISNESHTDSTPWQYHMISYIKNYERKKPKQHPVGMTVEYPDGDNEKLFASPADWISPANNGKTDNPATTDGAKVILSDTDHLCGVCGDYQWVWKSFTRGENPIFMDPYDNAFLLNSTLTPDSIPQYSLNDKRWDDVRRNLGYTLTYANRMNLVAMTPQNNLSSTGYCLANPNADKAEYLIYSPPTDRFEVDLSKTLGELSGEWFNLKDGLIMGGIRTTGGGFRSFMPPFKGDAVLYIYSK